MAFSAARLSQHVEQALAQATEQDVLAYAWSDGWQGDETLKVNGRKLRVWHCESSLQVREALTSPSDDPRILLISCEESDLGQDVLARLFRHRLLHVDRWQLVAEAYGAVQLDPRLYDIPWMADALLDAAPRSRHGSIPVLTHDQAMRACLLHALGVDDRDLDLEKLLAIVENGSAVWMKLPSERRDAFQRYLGSQLGSVAEAIMSAVNAGHGHAVLAIGLVSEVLFGSGRPAPEPLRDARVRLEPRLGGIRLDPADASHWTKAAKQVLARRDDAHRRNVFQLAIDLINNLGADDFIVESSVLPQALERRLEMMAVAVGKFLRKPDSLPKVEQAAEHVLKHEGIPAGDPAWETTRRVLSLCRREASLAQGANSGDAVLDYLQHGAWEDWARRSLRVVRPEALARVAGRLLDRVGKRRLESDRRFAEGLAQRLGHGTSPEHTLPIEDALKALAEPVAAERPLLILVLDGMSWDVYFSIALQLERTGWTGWRRPDGPSTLLATVPSVTECSRSSLLAGRLMRGNAGHEKREFARVEGLKRASRANKPPVLLHKAELEDGHQLSDQAAELIADAEQGVVGVVINAIDDALAKSDQVRIDWSMETIPLLGAILTLARQAGRAVLITSDHGHVIERGAEFRRLSETERWRPASDEPSAEEILIDGPRVNALMNGAVIVPWSENLRYTGKKNGYHGGATQQEMLVPVGIWTSGPERLECCEPAFIQRPEWWVGDDRDSGADLETKPAAPADQAEPKSATGQIDDLFATRSEKPAWIDALLASNALQHQRDRVGRSALEDDRIQGLLTCLEANGGRASVVQLASAIGQPQMRMRGILSILQRMLNLDGYPVVTVESGTQTVFLDIRTLKTQFDL